MNTFRVTVASLAGIVLVVAVAVGTSLATGSRAPVADQASAASSAPDHSAPAATNNPMEPVLATEASRRSELHSRFAEEQAAAAQAAQRDATAGAYVAPPVVTEVRTSTGDDALTRAIFEDQPKPAEPVAEKKPDPKPTPKPIPVKEEVKTPEKPKLPDYMRYYDQYQDRLRIQMQSNTPNHRVIQVHEQQSNLLLDALNVVFSAFVGTAYAGGLEEPLFDPTVAAPIRANVYGDGYVLGTDDLYASPSNTQRSAARPALVGIDELGRGYGTQEHRDAQMAQQQSGRIILARAGDLVYARLMYGFNSDDVRGLPIYAILTDILDTGEEGPLHNARVEGRIAYSNDNASISFNRIILDDGRDLAMAGIGISADAARTGVAAKVNKHRLWNFGALFLGGLMEGVSDVVTAQLENQGGNTIIITGDNSSGTTGTDTLTDGEVLAGALGPVGRNLAGQIQSSARPPTMKAPAGYIFGIVLLNTLVFDPAAMEGQPAYNPRVGAMTTVADAPNIPGVTGAAQTANQAADGWTVEAWDSTQTGSNEAQLPAPANDPIANGINP